MPRVERRGVVVRIDVAQEVPRRVDERVHRVRVAQRVAAAARARDVHPLLVGGERRLPLRRVVLDVRQEQRQLVLGQRDGAARVAVDDRDRRAPVALPREAPVAQPVRDGHRAAALLLERGHDRARAVRRRQSVVALGVDQPPVLVDHLDDRQPERRRELAVALVVRRDGHDRAGAVVHQDVVGDPDREPLAVDGVRRVVAGEDAGLLRLGGAVLGAARAGVARVRLRLLARVRLDERMLRRDDEERRAEQRVGARREDRQVEVEIVDAEEDLRALGAADPVALDRLRPLGPLAAGRQVVLEQLVGVRGRLEEPLRHVAQLDERAAALAVAVDDVLVRDHGLVVRAPVDRRLLPVRESLLEELEEQPLRPAVELRVGRRDLAVPVDRPAEPLHLRPDRRDVALGDLARMAALADRGVLRGQAERVPAHRPQHAPAAAAADVRLDVPHRVVEDVPHVDAVAGRVRQHLELVPVAVVRRARRAPDWRRRRPARPPRRAATSPRSPSGRTARPFCLQRRKSLS